MEEIFSLGNEKWLSKERNGKKGEINVLFSLLYRQIVRQAGWPEIALQIETQLGQKLYQFSYNFLPTAPLRGMQDFGIRKSVVKFGFFEKHTKFGKNLPHGNKCTKHEEDCANFVCFSESQNFNRGVFPKKSTR